MPSIGRRAQPRHRRDDGPDERRTREQDQGVRFRQAAVFQVGKELPVARIWRGVARVGGDHEDRAPALGVRDCIHAMQRIDALAHVLGLFCVRVHAEEECVSLVNRVEVHERWNDARGSFVKGLAVSCFTRSDSRAPLGSLSPSVRAAAADERRSSGGPARRARSS